MIKLFKNILKSKDGELQPTDVSVPPLDLEKQLNNIPEPSNTALSAAPEIHNSLFSKLKTSLSKSRENFATKLSDLFLGKKVIDPELLAELETLLLTADLGVATTKQIITALTQQVSRNELKNPSALAIALEQQLTEILEICAKPLEIPVQAQPFVILLVGINGAGKTTTIGKLAYLLQQQGKTVLLAAGDTFRAAAIEQLQTWGQRSQIPVIAQQPGADSASVIFDALQAATAKKYDVVLADTAGRLHTKDNLMAELQKIIRVLKKLDSSAPHEILLVIDASNGQNALAQAVKFSADLGVTGLILSKLDGTAKGGILVAIANTLKLPVRYLGLGEAITDLKPFNAKTFVQALCASHPKE